MPSVVIHAVELSILESSAPSASDINARFSGVNFGGGNWGSWAGPRPRVTRTAEIGQRFRTDAADVWTWPDNAWTAAHMAYMREATRAQVEASLSQISGSNWTVTVEEYSPAVNGELSWWASGQASVTQTRDAFPTGAGRLDANENPVGPTTPATHPTSPAEVGRGLLAGLGSGATIALVALAGYVLVTTAGVKSSKGSSSGSKGSRDLVPAI